MPPRTLWKSQPHRLIADWLGFVEPAHGESFPSGKRRGRTAPGEDRVSSPDQQYLRIPTTNSSNLRTKTGIPRVDTTPRGVETPTPLDGC